MKKMKFFTALISTVLVAMPLMAQEQSNVAGEEESNMAAMEQEQILQDMSGENLWWGMKVEYSPWFVEWKQTSTAATRFGSDAINVDYTIDGAVAHSARINLNIFDFGADLNVVDLPKGSAGEGQALSYLSMGVNYTDFVGATELHYRFESGSFTGFINGADNGGRVGTATFETDMTTHDIALLTQWGIGIGYRSFAYEVPQDVYLINTNTQAILQSGFVDMNYNADFYTLIFARDELLKKDTANFNVGLELRYGLGTMKPSGDFIDETKKALSDGNLDSNIIADADASFFELDVYVYMPLFPSDKITSELRGGYRSHALTAEFGEGGGDYALVTDFETSFSGPYLGVSAEF